MSEQRRETCENCRFWHQPTAEENALGPCALRITVDYPGKDDEGFVIGGECHRRAPLATPSDSRGDWPEDAKAVWPVTFPLDFCGEWQGEPPPQPAEKEKPPVDNTPLQRKDFTARAYRTLVLCDGIYSGQAVINTVGELASCSAKELLERRNFGFTSLRGIREFLAARGLKLRGD